MKIEKVNKNALLPSRGTAGAASYDLTTAEAAVVPVHSKCLVKTGLAMALPLGCYSRIAPRSGLTLKRFIDVGAGVIDNDYRGEVGVILFNFGDTDFVIIMGDKIAQLIFEKIDTPVIRETNNLEDTGRGAKGYGSTGVSQNAEIKPKTSDSKETKTTESASTNDRIQDIRESKIEKIQMNEPKTHVKKRSQYVEARRIMSAHQMQKLIKNDEPVFPAVVRTLDNFVLRGRKNKISPGYAVVNTAHGMTEGQRRKINKDSRPKKDIISVKEREKEVLDSVPAVYRESLEKFIQKY